MLIILGLDRREIRNWLARHEINPRFCIPVSEFFDLDRLRGIHFAPDDIIHLCGFYKNQDAVRLDSGVKAETEFHP